MFAISLLIIGPDPFKVEHPVAIQSASASGMKKLLRKRASDKVKSVNYQPGRYKRNKKGRGEVTGPHYFSIINVMPGHVEPKRRRSRRLNKNAESSNNYSEEPMDSKSTYRMDGSSFK